MRGTANGDIDMYGAFAPQHAGKHGDSLLGERGEGFPPATVSLQSLRP